MPKGGRLGQLWLDNVTRIQEAMFLYNPQHKVPSSKLISINVFISMYQVHKIMHFVVILHDGMSTTGFDYIYPPLLLSLVPSSHYCPDDTYIII